MRFLSHHDLMRCFERLLRRANLPVRTTAGFHPGPRIVFPSALPLGIVGWDEVVEIEFLQPQDPTEALTTLRQHAPPGLLLNRVRPIPLTLTGRVRRAEYRLALPPARVAELTATIQTLLAQSQLWVPRLRPTPKYLNVRPYLRHLEVRWLGPSAATPVVPSSAEALSADTGPAGAATAPDHAPLMHPVPLERSAVDDPQPVLHLDLWVTQEGTARAEEILRLLQLADLLEQGTVLERTCVELHDEMEHPEIVSDHPPQGPPETRPLDAHTHAALIQAEQQRRAGIVPEQRLEESVVE